MVVAGGDDAKRVNTLRSALATSMMGLNALDIETLNNDEHAWDVVVEDWMVIGKSGANVALCRCCGR